MAHTKSQRPPADDYKPVDWHLPHTRIQRPLTDDYKPVDWDVLQPPQEFRLIELAPGSGANPLSCRVIEYPFAACDGGYLALSYAWGSTELCNTIVCNGHNVRITKNLHSALRRFRNRTAILHVWCDALCIKQGDDPASLQERAEQIPLMNRIFGSAERVIIDLGDDDGTLSAALEAMSAIWRTPQELRARVHVEEDPAAYLSLPGGTAPMWSAISKFMSRAWFQRIWCVQEAVLARDIKVILGTYAITFDQLAIVVSVWSAVMMAAARIDQTKSGWDLVDLSHSRMAAVCLILTHRRRKARLSMVNKPSVGLCDLIQSTLAQHTTNPRDRIYALYGMVDSEMADVLPVSYTESVDRLSQRVSEYLIKNGNGAWALIHCGGMRPEGPSWTIDLSELGGEKLVDILASTTEVGGHNGTYAAGGNEPLSLKLIKDNEHIRIRGIVVDAILAMPSAFPLPVETLLGLPGAVELTPSWIVSYASWIGSVVTWAGQFPISDPEAVWRTLVANCDSIQSDAQRDAKNRPLPEFKACFDELLIWIDHIIGANLDVEHYNMQGLEAYPLPPQGVKFIMNMTPAMLCRRVARTRAGSFALVPAASEITDVVAVFQGVPVPFVLRAVEDGYCVVGTCYVHSMMDGEAFGKGLQIEDILLK